MAYINLSQFEVFCTVAKVKSFSKAARLLHLTQPAVSAQIHSLEDYFGVQLFRRSGQGVELTEAGELAYRYARQVLELVATMEKHLDSLSGLEEEELVVAASSSVGNYALPCSIWAFREQHPGARVRLEIANRSQVLAKIKENHVPVAVVEGPVEDEDGLAAFKVASDEVVIIAPPLPPWQDCQEIGLAELRKAPLIMREEGSGTRFIFEQAIGRAGLRLEDLNIVTELGSSDAVKSAVEAGLGLSVAGRLSVKKDLRRASMVALRLKDLPIPVDYYLLYRPQRFQSQVAKKFIRFLTADQASFC